MARFQLRESTEVEAVRIPLLRLDEHPVRDWPEMKQIQAYPAWLRQAFNTQLKPRYSPNNNQWEFELTESKTSGYTQTLRSGDWIVRERSGYLFKRSNEVMMQDYVELTVVDSTTEAGVPIFMPGSLNRERSVGSAFWLPDGMSAKFIFRNEMDRKFIQESFYNRRVAVAFIDSVPPR